MQEDKKAIHQANVGLGKQLNQQLKEVKKFLSSNTNDKFTDSIFPPNDDSIYDDIHKTQFQKSKKNNLYTWVRLTEFSQFEKLNILKLPEDYNKDQDVVSEDVIQGDLGDCYVLSALSAFAEFPKRILNLFEDLNTSKNGIYKIKCFLHGIPHTIIIDDYFPVHKSKLEEKDVNGKYDISSIAFAGVNKKTYNIWPILLEKVWAKVNSNYENIISGNCSEVFEFFSPAPFNSYLHENATEDSLFKKIKKFDEKKYVICTDITNYTGGDPTYQTKLMENIKSSGLVTNHAYSLIDCHEVKDKMGNDVQLLKIRNPWGNYEWSGDWSDKSDKWTPELKEQLNFEEEEDGTFFICYSDFLKYYTTTHVCMHDDSFYLNYKKFKILESDKKYKEKLIYFKITEHTSGFFMVNMKNTRIYKNFKNIDEFYNIYLTINVIRTEKTIDSNGNEKLIVHNLGSSSGRKNRHFIRCDDIIPGDYYFYISFPYEKLNKVSFTGNINRYSYDENLEESLINNGKRDDKNSDEENLNNVLLTNEDLIDIKEDNDFYDSLDGITYIVSLYSKADIDDNVFQDVSYNTHMKMFFKTNILKSLALKNKEKNKYYFKEEGEEKAFRSISFEKNKGGFGFIYIDNPTEAVLIEKFDFVELFGCYLKPIFFTTDKKKIDLIGKQSQDKPERELINNLKYYIFESANIRNSTNDGSKEVNISDSNNNKNNNDRNAIETTSDNKIINRIYSLCSPLNSGVIKIISNKSDNEVVSFKNNLVFDLIIPPFSSGFLQIVKFKEETGIQFKSQVVFIYPIFSLINEIKFFDKSDTVMLKYNDEEVEIYETLIVTESGVVFKYKNKTNSDIGSKPLILYIKMKFSNLVNLKLNKLLNDEERELEAENKIKDEKLKQSNAKNSALTSITRKDRFEEIICLTVNPGEVKAFELRVVDPFLEYDYNCESEVVITLY